MYITYTRRHTDGLMEILVSCDVRSLARFQHHRQHCSFARDRSPSSRKSLALHCDRFLCHLCGGYLRLLRANVSLFTYSRNTRIAAHSLKLLSKCLRSIRSASRNRVFGCCTFCPMITVMRSISHPAIGVAMHALCI